MPSPVFSRGAGIALISRQKDNRAMWTHCGNYLVAQCYGTAEGGSANCTGTSLLDFNLTRNFRSNTSCQLSFSQRNELFEIHTDGFGGRDRCLHNSRDVFETALVAFDD